MVLTPDGHPSHSTADRTQAAQCAIGTDPTPCHRGPALRRSDLNYASNAHSSCACSTLAIWTPFASNSMKCNPGTLVNCRSINPMRARRRHRLANATAWCTDQRATRRHGGHARWSQRRSQRWWTRRRRWPVRSIESESNQCWGTAGPGCVQSQSGCVLACPLPY